MGAQYGALAGIGVVAVGVVVAGVLMPVEWWGALAAWSGTVGALSAVAVAVFTTRLQADETARHSNAEQAEREIQQARLVTVEFTPSEWDDPEFSTHYDLTVTITNHSAALILDPRLEGFTHPEEGGQVDWDIADVPGYLGAPSVLRPDGKHRLPVTTSYHPTLSSQAAGTARRVEAVIGFTDAAGLRWRRVGSSLPVRMSATAEAPATDVEVAQTFRPRGPDWYRYDVSSPSSEWSG